MTKKRLLLCFMVVFVCVTDNAVSGPFPEKGATPDVAKVWANKVSATPEYETAANILGPFDGNVTTGISEGGEVVVQFGRPVTNGPGHDFVVWENGFGTRPLCYAELAYVAVSSDGGHWVTFPSIFLDDGSHLPDFLNVTDIYNLAGNYWANYGENQGTPFDLDDILNTWEVQAGWVDPDNITHIRLRDISGSGEDSDDATYFGYDEVHPIFDVVSFGGGADWDSVGAIHVQPRSDTVDSAYATQEVFLTTQDGNHWYSSGLDIVYVHGRKHFLALWNTNQNLEGPPPYTSPLPQPSVGNALTLALYDYKGRWVMDLATYSDPANEDETADNDLLMYPQSVKLAPSGDVIWVTYTSSDASYRQNVSDWICTVPWDETLVTYLPSPVAMTPVFPLPGNWEIEWSTDSNAFPSGQGGALFVSGPLPTVPASPFPAWEANTNGIYLYRDDTLQPVIEVGGNSSGFAFDNHGNLWIANVAPWGETDTIFMWTADQIDQAITDRSYLTTDEAEVSIPTPDSLAGGDVERDGAGNIYFSLNGGDTYIGRIVRIDNTGHAPWPDAVTTITETVAYYDWQRSLAYDGQGDLTSGGVLYVDMDQPTQGSTLPNIVEIAASGDSDSDGVPDTLDNCRQTPNSDQSDVDGDEVGNLCEGDCDRDGQVDDMDIPYVAQDYGRFECEIPCLSDTDGDGNVDGMDLATMAGNLTGH